MRSIRRIGITALALAALAGCTPDRAKEYTVTPVPMAAEKGAKAPTPETIDTKVSSITGTIVQIQTSSLPVTNSTYEFIYVILQDANGKDHVLIYPHSHAIIVNRLATIDYNATANGQIGATQFGKNFVQTNYSSMINFPIKAEGIIIPDGIRYN